MPIITKKIVVKKTKHSPRIVKEVTFLIGRGKNCKCSDCPVLYGDDCPYDTVTPPPIIS